MQLFFEHYVIRHNKVTIDAKRFSNYFNSEMVSFSRIAAIQFPNAENIFNLRS